jgi:acetyl esterase/lipase
MLADNHEGRQVANWFNAMGVTAFVLKYRLGPGYHHPIELGDAQRAIRLVRSRAKEFEVSPDRIGMMGFSAGGHLASTAATHFDSGNPGAADSIDHASSRPDFVILGYPVITFEGPMLTADPARICSATIQIRSWFRNSLTNCKSLPRLRPHSYSPRVTTRWCPRKTV